MPLRPAAQPRRGFALALGTAAVLLPFAGKPIHLDEPVYVWVAQHILESPLDFQGLVLNWTGRSVPLAEENMNPPLVSFYLAAAGAVAGWRETVLHLWMLLPALAAALGCHALASRLCATPLTATLVALCTPAFLVSATTLMADVPALALWTWSAVLWIDGLDRGSGARLAAAGLLAALCFLTKYLGAALLPLLLVYTLARPGVPRARLAYLAIPLLAIAAYQAYAAAAWGRVPLLDAASYASGRRAESAGGALESGLVGAVFLGGCYASALCLAPLLWRGGVLVAGAGAALLLAGALGLAGGVGPFAAAERPAAWLVLPQLALFALGGAQLLGLALADWTRRRSADALLLLLWTGGIFAFASFVNWTTSARALLPAAPAVGVLVARRLEQRGGERPDARPAVLLALAPALALAFAVAWADYAFAASARAAAFDLARRYGGDGTLWFQGAWGFQYYMEARGARKVDADRSRLLPGDALVLPLNNSDVGPLPPDRLAGPLEIAAYPAASWVATIQPALGAGFYSSRWGPLPFAFGPAPPERYDVRRVRVPLEPRTTGGAPP